MNSAVYLWLAMTELQAMLVLSVKSDYRVGEVRIDLEKAASLVRRTVKSLVRHTAASSVRYTVNRQAPLAADCRFQVENLVICLAERRFQSIEVWDRPMAHSAC